MISCFLGGRTGTHTRQVGRVALATWGDDVAGAATVWLEWEEAEEIAVGDLIGYGWPRNRAKGLVELQSQVERGTFGNGSHFGEGRAATSCLVIDIMQKCLVVDGINQDHHCK